jgi:hypothetical protein
MYKVLITSIYNGNISTSIAEFNNEREADAVITRLAGNGKHGVVRFAERLN